MKQKPKRFSKWIALVFVVVLVAGIAFALTRTQRPRTIGEKKLSGSSKIILTPKDNLQEAIDRARPGDTIVLEAGGVFAGSFRLPKKPGDAYVTIQSSRLAELAEGVRVSPSQAPLFAKLQSGSNAEPIVSTQAGAHHYRFLGIEFAPANSDVAAYDLVRLGAGRESQTILDSVPHHLVIDRCYIHGFTTRDVQRGISLNSAETSITNSYISDIHGIGYDTQAVAGWNGPGPFHIINNYLEAAGENIMFGGADPAVPSLIPSNIEIRQNDVFKPLSWKVNSNSYGGRHWTVKNLLELKNAKNVLIDGNVFENCWVDAQTGYGILFTVRNQEGTAPWSILENVKFTNNIVKNAAGALNLLGSDNEKPSQRSTTAIISNNLFTGIGSTFLQMNGYYNVTVEHNTHFQSGSILVLYGQPSTGFTYRDNLTIRAASGYGVFGDGIGEGVAALSKFAPGYTFEKNILVGADPSQYPPNNFFPVSIEVIGFVDYNAGNYRLSPKSRYRNIGSDRTDIGCNFGQLSRVKT